MDFLNFKFSNYLFSFFKAYFKNNHRNICKMIRNKALSI